MSILILTEPDDKHALAVKLALEYEGKQARLLFTADQPTKLEHTIFIDNHDTYWNSVDQEFSINNAEYDIVWWRRARKPHLPSEILHPDDYKFALGENLSFFEFLTGHIAQDAWWINEKLIANQANKLRQLKLANLCGMSIPSTLISNNPTEIRKFIAKHENQGAIYKPLQANFWFEENETKISYTTDICLSKLPSNQMLRLVPGIYQAAIPKQYELRITCFGDHLVAAKLNSQQHPEGKQDWRKIQDKGLEVEPYDLPPEIVDKIRKFMRTIGLVFGAIDIIVTPNNEYIFLEVNEQGQFLWVEALNPNIKMLDCFVQFLLSKTREFVWDPNQCKHPLQNYQSSIFQRYTEQMQKHVFLNGAENLMR